MIGIKTKKEGDKFRVVYIHYKPESLSQTQKDKLIILDELPEDNLIAGVGEKIELYYDLEKQELYYEIVERELTENEKIAEIVADLENLKTENAQFKQESKDLQDVIDTMLGGGE